jgi:hypothetical protein
MLNETDYETARMTSSSPGKNSACPVTPQINHQQSRKDSGNEGSLSAVFTASKNSEREGEERGGEVKKGEGRRGWGRQGDSIRKQTMKLGDSQG